MTPSALVVGAGDALGGAIARRFARGGLVACPVRRSADKLASLVAAVEADGNRIVAFGRDARVEQQMIDLVEEIETTIGPLEVAVFNVGANVPSSILEETERKYRKIWEMAALGGFLMGREAAKRMVVRGREHFAAFSGAKHALRALAQSMARELGPRGVHVAHVLIDGAIDSAFIRDTFPDLYARKAEGGILDPEHIAEHYWMLHAQPRDTWTFELDLRPWSETW
jgi:NAD(P)-dependent dehydrogenase (short-subunit alcohol dehydrogenase family)